MNVRVLKIMFSLVAVLSLSACVEDTFGFDIPRSGDPEVVQTNVSMACWYASDPATTLAPMRVDMTINRITRRVNVMISDISRVSRSVEDRLDDRLRVRCASQYISEGGRYRLPGPGELADRGFVVVGIYFQGDANFLVSVNEYRLDSTGTRIDIIPWLDGPYGRAPRPLPAPRM